MANGKEKEIYIWNGKAIVDVHGNACKEKGLVVVKRMFALIETHGQGDDRLLVLQEIGKDPGGFVYVNGVLHGPFTDVYVFLEANPLPPIEVKTSNKVEYVH